MIAFSEKKKKEISYHATGAYVLVRMIVQETQIKTSSGIVLSTDALGNRTGMEVNPKQGVVLEIGSDVKLPIKKGDTILFNPYDGYGIEDLDSRTHFGWVKDMGIIGYLTSK